MTEEDPVFLHPDAGAADNGSAVLGTAGSPASSSASASASSSSSVAAGQGAGASASQRARFLPPDQPVASFWSRHGETVRIAELVLAGVFILLALYFVFLWVSHVPDVSYAPDREGFREALFALAPAGADPSWRVASAPGRWRGIVIHHTAGAQGSVASLDRYHREENKWPNGLGYHFLIGNGNGMGDGEIAVGPRWEKQLDGAHVRMKGTAEGNSFSIGVALVGNFESVLPSPRQLAALRGVLRFLVEEYGISSSAIAGHGEVAERYTACPGRLLFVDEVVRSLS